MCVCARVRNGNSSKNAPLTTTAAHTNIRRKIRTKPDVLDRDNHNHKSEGGQVLVEKDARSGDEQTNKKNVLCCFLKKKGHISRLRPHSRRGYPTTATSRAPKGRCRRRRGRTRRGRWWRHHSRIIDAHFPPDDLESLEHLPPRTQCRNALSLECLLIHKHHFLPRHTLKVRRVLVQSERAEPSRDVVQYCRVEIFFVFLRAAVVISCGG